MLAKHERIDPLELTVFAIVVAIIAWPLVSLLIVLAQTANGKTTRCLTAGRLRKSSWTRTLSRQWDDNEMREEADRQLHKLTVLSPPIPENVDRFAAGPITDRPGARLA